MARDLRAAFIIRFTEEFDPADLKVRRRCWISCLELIGGRTKTNFMSEICKARLFGALRSLFDFACKPILTARTCEPEMGHLRKSETVPTLSAPGG